MLLESLFNFTSTNSGAIFTDAVSACGQTGDLVFVPNDMTQNAVAKATLALWVRHDKYFKARLILIY